MTTYTQIQLSQLLVHECYIVNHVIFSMFQVLIPQVFYLLVVFGLKDSLVGCCMICHNCYDTALDVLQSFLALQLWMEMYA